MANVCLCAWVVVHDWEHPAEFGVSAIYGLWCPCFRAEKISTTTIGFQHLWCLTLNKSIYRDNRCLCTCDVWPLIVILNIAANSDYVAKHKRGEMGSKKKKRGRVLSEHLNLYSSAIGRTCYVMFTLCFSSMNFCIFLFFLFSSRFFCSHCLFVTMVTHYVHLPLVLPSLSPMYLSREFGSLHCLVLSLCQLQSCCVFCSCVLRLLDYLIFSRFVNKTTVIDLPLFLLFLCLTWQYVAPLLKFDFFFSTKTEKKKKCFTIIWWL